MVFDGFTRLAIDHKVSSSLVGPYTFVGAVDDCFSNTEFCGATVAVLVDCDGVTTCDGSASFYGATSNRRA